jgi:hypothetical protein
MAPVDAVNAQIGSSEIRKISQVGSPQSQADCALINLQELFESLKHKSLFSDAQFLIPRGPGLLFN